MKNVVRESLKDISILILILLLQFAAGSTFYLFGSDGIWVFFVSVPLTILLILRLLKKGSKKTLVVQMDEATKERIRKEKAMKQEFQNVFNAHTQSSR